MLLIFKVYIKISENLRGGGCYGSQLKWKFHKYLAKIGNDDDTKGRNF